DIFGKDGFLVAAQTYKTAFIITHVKTRKEFVEKLALLDAQLRKDLLDILQQVLDDTKHPPSDDQKKEINNLKKKLKEGYRFDIYFGLRTLAPTGTDGLVNTYLLVTEALKGAALSRYVAKSENLETRAAQQFAAKAGVSADPKKLDPRGKEYDWEVYLRT